MENALRAGAVLQNRPMLLRLDPAHPPLWRSASTLQFGADAVAVIEEPTRWQQRLIAELERGIPDGALDPVAIALGAPERAAAPFLRRIAAALWAPAAASPQLRVQIPSGLAITHAETLLDAFAQTGAECSRSEWFGAPDETVKPGPPVVVVAYHLVEPRRIAPLMSADVTHVPLILTGTGAQIGPVVVPGRTACLACVAAHRRDADDAWPQIAAQLLGRPAPPVSTPILAEAAFAAVRMISEPVLDPGAIPSTSLTLHARSALRSTLPHRPHAECRCRSLGGSATAAGREVLSTMTSSGLGRPA